MTRADSIPFAYSHPVSYFKTAFGLILLREDILGPERFDTAFRKFIRDWAYKHPQPSDFFRAIDSEGGEDLSWFWRGWFFHNWALDLALDAVTYADGDPAKGASIAVSTRAAGDDADHLQGWDDEQRDHPSRNLDPVRQPHFRREWPPTDRERDHRS